MENGVSGKPHTTSSDFSGFFCFSSGKDEDEQPPFRVGILKSKSQILWNAGYKNEVSDYCINAKYAHNINYNIDLNKLDPELDPNKSEERIVYYNYLRC